MCPPGLLLSGPQLKVPELLLHQPLSAEQHSDPQQPVVLLGQHQSVCAGGGLHVLLLQHLFAAACQDPPDLAAVALAVRAAAGTGV